MAISIIKNNADALELELDWFYKILDTRIKLHFGHESDYKDVFDIEPPQLDRNHSIYADFLAHYNLSIAERIVFLLGVIPHVKPQLLDVFFTKNEANARDFTEFGRRNGYSYGGFLPTGETALFILAGDDIEKRIYYGQLFNADHVFNSHAILKLDSPRENEPEYSGFINISKEIVDLVTTGVVSKPIFSVEFPAKRIETQLEWAELVLDSSTMEQVLEIKAWVDYGDKLLNDLELGRKIKPGYRSLFYGPSGTGKTLTASLLGKVTGNDVYRIDLSMIISKYIGETEKNLEKVFEKAEHKNWILFFDEADALFGKRTNISDAHDRFANQEVSYLLQRVEDYAGVVILSSNFKSNIDEAFTRRFQSIIHFPMPKETERLKLWKQGFSKKTKLASDVSLKNIANDFELSGGSIMNVIRYATLMALKRDSDEIIFTEIQNGIRREFQKEGKAV